MSTQWTEQEEEYLKGIINKPVDFIHAHFKNKLGKDEGFEIYRSTESISRKIRRVKDSEDFDEMAYVDERWQRLLTLWEKYKEDEQPAYMTTGKKDRFILSLSDLHLPFTPIKRIEDILDTWKDELKSKDGCIVLNGDIMDQYAASSFGKYKKVALIDEYSMSLDLIDLCLDYSDYVAITAGNHEARFSRLVHEHLSEEVASIIPTDLLVRLSNGEEIDRFGSAKGIREHFKGRVIYQRKESWYIRIGKTIFAHPMAFKNGPGGTSLGLMEFFNARYNKDDYDSIVTGHCFDEETEILTQNGWKSIDTIDKSDIVLSVNKESNNIVENEINDIHKYDDIDELIYFGSKGNFEIAVTPQHGMIYKTVYNKNKDWCYNTAENIENKYALIFPCAAIRDNKEDFSIDDDMLKFLAWTVTKGSYDKHVLKNGLTTFSIRLAQSDDPKENYISRIESILNNLKFKYSKSLRYKANTTIHGQYRNFDAYRFNISRSDSLKVLEYLDENKLFKWDFLNKLSLRQRLLLIEELCMGDGSKCSRDNFVHYYTKSEILRDQVQYLLVTSGLRSTFSKRKDNTFVISIGYTDIRMPGTSYREKYKGKTWCLTVAEGTLIARRKGWTFITQNTHQLYKGIVSNKLLIEQGALCGRLGYEHQSNLKFKHSQNGYAVVYQDEKGNTNFNESRFIYCGSMLPKKKTVII